MKESAAKVLALRQSCSAKLKTCIKLLQTDGWTVLNDNIANSAWLKTIRTETDEVQSPA